MPLLICSQFTQNLFHHSTYNKHRNSYAIHLVFNIHLLRTPCYMVDLLCCYCYIWLRQPILLFKFTSGERLNQRLLLSVVKAKGKRPLGIRWILLIKWVIQQKQLLSYDRPKDYFPKIKNNTVICQYTYFFFFLPVCLRKAIIS